MKQSNFMGDQPAPRIEIGCDGNGVRVALVKRIVEMHNGRI